MVTCTHPIHEIEIDMGAEGGLHTAPKHIMYHGECTACGADVKVGYSYDLIMEAHSE